MNDPETARSGVEETNARVCWAASLGGCSAKMSREHVISSSQFETDTITIQGLPWCPDQRTVGVASLTSKNLCTAHNEELSPVDAEAAKLKKALRTLTTALNGEASGRVGQTKIRGLRIERWLLKTAFNLVMQHKPYAQCLFDGVLPAEKYVRIAFGKDVFRQPEGLRWIAEPDETVGGPSGFAFRTWLREDDQALVALFARFHGHRLWLALEGAPSIRYAQVPRLIDAPRAGGSIRFLWPSTKKLN